jgi:hypothetical protein
VAVLAIRNVDTLAAAVATVHVLGTVQPHVSPIVTPPVLADVEMCVSEAVPAGVLVSVHGAVL